MTSDSSKIELIKRNIKSYPDFPKPGIVFRDVFGILKNPEAIQALRELLLAHSTQYLFKIDAVCALESRGFLIGPLISLHLQVPFIPIRKSGKLPGETNKISCDMEYGSTILEIQTDALKKDSNVILVDDLLATGASLEAACKLVSSIGSKVDHCLVIMELEELKGRFKVPCPVHSLIKL